MIMTREEAVTIIDNLHLIGCGRNQHENDLRINVALDMAIEALSRSGDLISRADAMSKCKNAEKELTDEAERKGLRVARFIIGELPSAEAEWIPCSDRLPIPPTFCLVTTDGSHGDVIDIALYMSDGWHKASEVLAWMPLPKPYR